jgi:uncharacterized protein (DUF58 family)
MPEMATNISKDSAGEDLEKLLSVRKQAEQLAERLPPLLVAAERVAVTVAQGVHGRRRVGVGETFWQFRPYQFGDSSARIDWRQSARTTQLFLREQEWEAAESVWLWTDGSSSMDYRSDPSLPTKDDRALMLVLALVSLLIRAGERVAFLGSGRRPIGGRAGMMSFCEQLMSQRDDDRSLPVDQHLPHYARVVMISDFFTDLDQLKTKLRGFSGLGIRGHLLQVIDPAEDDLPFSGRVRFDDIEEGDSSALIGDVDNVRERYQRRIQAHIDGVREIGRSLGWTVALHRTGRSPEPALLGLYNVLANMVQG